MEVAVRPIRILSTILALQAPKNKLQIFQTALILIFLTVIIVIRQILDPVSKHKCFIVSWVEFASYNFPLLTVFCCLIMAKHRFVNIESFFTSVGLLDKKFTSLGIHIEFDYKFIRKLLFLLIIKVILQQIPFCLKGTSWTVIDYLDYTVYNIPPFIIHVLLIQWIIYVTVLQNHFKALNMTLKTFRYSKWWIIEDYRSHRQIFIEKEVIQTCGTISEILFSQVEKLDKAFEWSFIILIPTSFIQIIFYSFQGIRMIINFDDFNISWIIFDILQCSVFLELILPCSKVQKEFEKYKDILQKIKNKEIDEIINILLLYSHHKKIEFSICGVFTLDRALIYTILGALTTYLVILLQFDW